MNRKILVLGAGTAGCAAAVFLRQLNFEVVLADRQPFPDSTGTFKIGESLSPDATTLLQQLGIWEAFCAGPHLKCYGNLSYWHSEKATHHDFLQHPIGHGWHLGRLAFDQMLLKKAIDAGAEFLPQTQIRSFKFEEEQWKLFLQSTDSEKDLSVDFIVDASGRNSWLPRQLGIDRLYEAEQLALVTFLEISPEFEDTRTLVETTDKGWWYTAPIPGNRMTAVFFYSPDQLKLPGQPGAEEWKKLLNESLHTAKRIEQAEGQLITEPTTVAAHSSILEALHGPGWVAVGDAALTYDPIAAHGITMALTSARDAAKALSQHFEGNPKALAFYEAVLWAAFQRYAEERQRFTPINSKQVTLARL